MQKYGSWLSGITNYNDGTPVSGSVENPNEGAVSDGPWFSRLNFAGFYKPLLWGADASSGLHRNEVGFSPLMAFAWNINDEKFLSNVDNITELGLG